MLVLALAPVALAADADSDGLSDSLEAALGSDPNSAHSDSDSWNDYDEVFVHGTSPIMGDTDGDGFLDSADSDPLLYDTSVVGGSSSVTGTTLPTALWAASGESAQDGQGVYVHNGAFVYSLGVAQARGVVLPFGFSAKYISQAGFNGTTGMNWISMLDLVAKQQAGGDVKILTPDGRYVTFTAAGGGFTTPDGDLGTLTEPDPGEFLWTMPGGSSLRFVGDHLQKIAAPDGNATTITWSSGQATKATDSRGLDHTFAYYSTGRLKTISMADGRVWTFEYNDNDQLARITGPVTTTFPDGIMWEFRYTSGSQTGSLNDNMIAAIDGNGQSWMTLT